MSNNTKQTDDNAGQPVSNRPLGGFSVICVNTKGVLSRAHHRPHGPVRKGLIYRVLRETNKRQAYVILGKPTLLNGKEIGWWKWRFKRRITRKASHERA